MKKQIRLIIVEDNYASKLAELFHGVGEFSNLEIVTATNLEEANLLLDESDSSSTIVLSDLMFPNKKETTDAEEAIEIFREICIHYGVNPENLNSYVEDVIRVIYKFYKETEEMKELILKKTGKRITNDELMSIRHLPSDKEIKSQLYTYIELQQDAEVEIIEIGRKYMEKGLFEPLKTVFLDPYFSFKSGYNDRVWDFGVGLCPNLVRGKKAGASFGIRVFQKSFSKGIPCTIVTGDHSASTMPVIAAYLKDSRCSRSNDIAAASNVLNEDGAIIEFEKGNILYSNFFVVNKECDLPGNNLLLIEIVKSLIHKMRR